MRTLMLTAVLALAASAAQFCQIKGKVSVRPGDDNTWSAATAATPLTSGNHVATGARSAAGIQVDPSFSVQMAAASEVWLEQLDPGDYRLSVVKGSVRYYVAPDFAGHASIATPNVSVGSSLPGAYLIVVKASGQSEIAAEQGAAQVMAANGSEWVNAGQKLVARGSAANPEYKIGSAISFWRRAAFLMATSVQVASVVAEATSSGDGDGHREHTALRGADQHKTAEAPRPHPSEPTRESGRGK